MERTDTGAGPEGAALDRDPKDYAERIDLLADIAVTALSQDRTRIVTLMLANEGSNRPYKDIGVNDGHHEVSHHGNDPAKSAKFAAINRWQAARFGRLLERMRAREEAGATLLDRTMVLYGGAIGDGNRHNHDDLPVVLAGGQALGVRLGAEHASPAGTPLCNLFVSMLGTAGAPVDRFGDSTGALNLAGNG